MSYEMSVDEIKREMVKLLAVFDSYCKKYQVEYYAACGTLLGAVRHKGFIPWDDDIDIIISRKNMECFVRSFNEDLEKDNRYFIQYRDHYSEKVKCRIYFCDGTTMGPEGSMGICLDGFILESVPDNIFKRFLGNFYERVLILKPYNTQNLPLVKKCIINIMKILTFIIPKEVAENGLLKILNAETPDTKYVTILRKDCGIAKYPRSIFRDVVQLQFENITIPAPIGYKTYLEMVYGDYMTPLPVSERTKEVGRVWKM